MGTIYKKFLKRKYRGNMMEDPPETELRSSKLTKRIEYLSSTKSQKISLTSNPSFSPTVRIRLFLDFRLWINEALIRDDIDNLRAVLRRPLNDDEPKKVKKIKQD